MHVNVLLIYLFPVYALHHHSADAGISGIELKLLLSTTELCKSFFRVMKGLNMKLVSCLLYKKEVTCHMILKDFISPYSSQ